MNDFNVGDVVRVHTKDKYDGSIGEIVSIFYNAASVQLGLPHPQTVFAFGEMEILLKDEDRVSHMESDTETVELPVEMYEMLTDLLVTKTRTTVKIYFDSVMAGQEHNADSYGEKLDKLMDDIETLNKIRQVKISDKDVEYFTNMLGLVNRVSDDLTQA